MIEDKRMAARKENQEKKKTKGDNKKV